MANRRNYNGSSPFLSECSGDNRDAASSRLVRESRSSGLELGYQLSCRRGNHPCHQAALPLVGGAPVALRNRVASDRLDPPDRRSHSCGPQAAET